MTRIHAELVWATAIVLLVILYTLWKSDAPARIQESGRILLGAMVVQGVIGYTQYFTRLPAVLVGIHVIGATIVVSVALWFHHGLSDHRPEVVDGRVTEPSGAVETAPVGDIETIVDQDTTEDRPWLVIVWNDPINLMSFVTFVLQKLFGYSKEKATALMLDIHHKGRAVVSSGTRERAELDVYRLHEHGLWATMEQSG